jgi:Cell division protein CrgA
MADQPDSSPAKKTPPKKKASTSGRVTPKGTRSGEGASPRSSGGHPEASTRYTPPIPLSEKITAPWVVPVMFLLLGLGVAMILLNYMEVLPGSASDWYLIGGLGLILGGILTATQLR